MDEYELLREIQRGLHRGVPQADLERYLQLQSGGKYQSIQGFQDSLRGQEQDLASQSEAPSGAMGALESFGSGLTFGWNDELAGAFDALTGGDYRTTRDYVRGQEEALRRSNPKTAIGLTLAGGLLPAFLTGGGSTEATAGQLAMQGVKFGAGAGALAGAGEAKETEDILPEAATGAAAGGLFGGTLGLAVKPVTGLVGGLYRLARRGLAPGRAAEAEAPGILSRFLPQEPTLSQSISAIERQRPGQGLIADLAPKATDVAGEMNPTAGGQLQEAVTQRNMGAGTRLAEDLTQATTGTTRGLNAVEAEQYAKGLVDAYGAPRDPATGPIRQTARKLYGPLEAEYPEIVPSEETAAVFDALAEPHVRDAYQSLAPMAEHNPSFRLLQSTLEKLKGRAGSLMGQGGGRTTALEMYDQAATLERAMEKVMPGFKAANRGYAQTMEAAGAFEQGAKAWRADPREISYTLKSMGKDAKNAYRMAALDDLLQRLHDLSPEGNAFREALRSGNKSMESRMEALFGNTKELGEFMLSANVEALFRNTYNALTGSKTFGRGEVARVILGTGEGEAVPGKVSQFFRNLAEQGRRERIGGALSDRLATRFGSPEGARVLEEVAQARRGLASRNRLTRQVVQGLPVFAADAARLWEQR